MAVETNGIKAQVAQNERGLHDTGARSAEDDERVALQLVYEMNQVAILCCKRNKRRHQTSVDIRERCECARMVDKMYLVLLRNEKIALDQRVDRLVSEAREARGREARGEDGS